MSSADAIRPGSRFGPYELQAIIGRGGMGAVWRVRHGQTGVTHALKVIIAARLTDEESRERALERFRREAEVLARLSDHPGIARVYTCGIDQGIPWCSMEFIEGRSLAERLKEGPLSPRPAARLVAAVARAVAHAHAHGVVHRDLKPENVLLEQAPGREPQPRLIDFGLAYDLFADRLTRTGEVLGTPAFMAPEQVRGRGGGEVATLGPATDVYGLGAILYATLTGRPPFDGANMLNIMAEIIRGAPQPPRRVNPQVPAELEQVCLRALKSEPDARYPTAAEMADDLERWLRGEPLSSATGHHAASRLRSALRRRTRVELALGGLIAVAALSAAVAVGWSRTVGALGGRLDRVRGLEAAFESAGALSPRETKDLEELVADEADLAEDLRRRVALLDALRGLLATEPAEAAGARADLAALVRTADGDVDRPLLQRAVAVLHRARRFDALNAVLHGATPVVPAPPEVVTGLAAAIAAGGPGLEPPRDENAFAALQRARGLEDAQRGRLLTRHGDALVAAGEDRWDEALAGLGRAVREHGAVGLGAGWPAAFHHRLHATFAAAAGRGDLDAARAALDLVARIDERHEVAPVPDLVARFHHETVLRVGETRVDAHDRERAFLIAAYLDRYGEWMSMPRDFVDKHREGWRALLERVVGEELAREPSRRNPALLAFAGAVLVDGWDEDPRPAQWTREAMQTGVDGVWLRVQAAWVLEGEQDHLSAIEHLERAVELDRARPMEKRWPMAPERLARCLLAVERKMPERPDPDRIVRSLLEAARVQHAVLPRISARAKAGAFPSFRLSRSMHLMRGVREVALDLIALGKPHCCLGGATEGSSIDALVDAGESLLDEPALGQRNTMSAWGVSRGVLEGLRGAHLAAHGHHGPALPYLDRAVEAERTRTMLDNSEDFVRLRSLAEWLDRRAATLRALEREEDAKRDDEEAEGCRRKEKERTG